MIVKKHISNSRLILAVCDEDLLGKKFEENNLQLDLSSNFYKGEKMNEEDLTTLIKKAYLINLVGKKSVDLALKIGIINKNNIIKIKGVPHAQSVLLTE